MSDDLELRHVDLDDAKIELRAEGDDGRTMAGFPVVFNQWTRINDAGGAFLERIHPKALTKTLAERGHQVKVLFNHGQDPSIGEKPLGKARTQEVRDDGLYVEVPLARTSYNADLVELMRDGAIDGMSFRFGVVKEDWDDTPTRSESNPDQLPERTVTELRLYEYGPVTFPAYPTTSVSVRSHLSSLEAGPEGDTTSDAEPDNEQAEAGPEGTTSPVDVAPLEPVFDRSKWQDRSDHMDRRLAPAFRTSHRR